MEQHLVAGGAGAGEVLQEREACIPQM